MRIRRLEAFRPRSVDGVPVRAALVEERTRLSNRLERRSALPPLVARHLDARLAALAEEIREVEEARRELVRSDPGLSRDLDALVRLPGVGETSTILVLAFAGDVEGYPTAQSYAAAGLAPCRRESGAWKGRGRISKQGGASWRNGLYMATVAAVRWDPVLEGFRNRLLEKGKTKMQALVACMRKLLMRSHGILKAVRNGREPCYGNKPNARENPNP